tara:strand:- start:292 stop:750 length:459 start_codon:yes stop_codon:yes gene_type:complete
LSNFDYKKYLKNNPLLQEKHEFTDQDWDPVTRTLSSTVKYTPDFSKAYDDLEDSKKSMSALAGKSELIGDDQLKRIKDLVKNAFNKYRTHLRTNYKDEYADLKRRGGGLEEMTTTGGAGAYNTPYAFNKNKKAKGTNRDYYLSKLGYKLVNK